MAEVWHTAFQSGYQQALSDINMKMTTHDPLLTGINNSSAGGDPSSVASFHTADE
jgi:hypothetical protein